MIQKCPNCGQWNYADYKKNRYALGRFIDNLMGVQGGAEFKCSCGNTWMELDRRKDQSAKYYAENPDAAKDNSKSNLKLSKYK